MSGGHGAHDLAEGSNKKIALLIAVLALFLALAETAAKSAQTATISANVEASNLWSYFQAKTVRQTTLRTAAETLEVQAQDIADPATKEALGKRIAGWKDTIQRYESDPKENDGRKELAARAKQVEAHRDVELSRYHMYEVSSGILQVAIVIASATIITGVAILFWIAGGLGLVGLAFAALGLLAPTLIHL